MPSALPQSREHGFPARQGFAALERAALRALPAGGLSRGPSRLRVRPLTALGGGWPPHGRARAARAALEADDDHARAPHGAREARAPRARRRGPPCRAHLADRAQPGIPEGGPRGPRRARGPPRGRPGRRPPDPGRHPEKGHGAMRSESVTTVLQAPREEVFDYLSDIENLPDW